LDDTATKKKKKKTNCGADELRKCGMYTQWHFILPQRMKLCDL
jgi:hypothetical protein